MKLRRIWTPSPTAVSAVVTLAGVAAALAGVYLLLGLGVTLIVGGLAAAAAGLLVDVD